MILIISFWVRVAELVDALGLGPSGATRGSSTLPPDTKNPAAAGFFTQADSAQLDTNLATYNLNKKFYQ